VVLILNKLLVWFLPFIPKFIVGIFSKKYIAGATLIDAINAIQRFNQRGIMTTVDILGEEIEQRTDALKVVQEYKNVLSEIEKNKLDSNISIKPTHLGLKIDKTFCFENIKDIVEEAKKYGNFVRIDMEDHTCTSETIDIYLELKKTYDNVGVVVQSYLRRTIDDLNKLIAVKANLRLCKGIYIEPKSISYKDPEIVNSNFNYSLKKLLSNGCYVGIATHDEKLIWHAFSLIDELNLSKDSYEFQMLLGVTEELRDIIVESGHRMRIYIPFGEHWYAYSMRRLKENPNVAKSIIRHIFVRS
jgi:proline dehydrogenase